MNKNHSLQALYHILGASIILLLAFGMIYISNHDLLISPWLLSTVQIIGGILSLTGLYILAGGMILLLRSRIYS